MTSPAPKEVLFRKIATVAGAVSVVVGAAVLAGWAADIEALKRVAPGLVAMKANAAASVVLLGLSIVTLGPDARGASRVAADVFAGLALLVGALTLVQYLIGADFGLDQLLFREEAPAVDTASPGRMAPTAAGGFVLLAAALLLVDRGGARLHRVAELLAAAVFLAALQAFLGYVFGVDVLYEPSARTAMALHSSLLLLVLATGTLFLRTGRGFLQVMVDPGAAGFAVRRLVPAAVLLPLFAGALAAFAVDRGVFSERSALTAVVSFLIVFGLGAILWAARGTLEIDHDRRRLIESEREARKEAEEASRAKSEFLGVMSHELRTPLNSIVSYADLLDAEIKGPLNPDQTHYVERIEVGADHLREMIDEILKFTRVDAGALQSEWDVVDVVELAREAATVVARERDLGTAPLKLELPDGPVEVETDEAKVLHVLVNFLDNAVKYCPEGEIEFSMKTPGAHVVFEVRDGGPGIPPDEQERIFEPFVQSGSPTVGKGGTGLGLAISSRFADLVGGEIELDSEVGRGSAFRLILPVRRG